MDEHLESNIEHLSTLPVRCGHRWLDCSILILPFSSLDILCKPSAKIIVKILKFFTILQGSNL